METHALGFVIRMVSDVYSPKDVLMETKKSMQSLAIMIVSILISISMIITNVYVKPLMRAKKALVNVSVKTLMRI